MPTLNRRAFFKTSIAAAGGIALCGHALEGRSPAGSSTSRGLSAGDLPKGAAPAPVALPHFPDLLHAFVWRNWPLVRTERMAKVLQAKPAEILRLGKAMGLPSPPRITAEQQRRSYITVIRRNWHLLPYEQLLELLDWTPEQMAFTLREDDFLFVKFGNLKPQCEPLRYAPPDQTALARERAIAQLVREHFPGGVGRPSDPPFGFIARLSRPLRTSRPPEKRAFSPRFCYSYFALYGDPLLDRTLDPYPEGYLARLAAAGVEGVWLQGVLSKLAPFPWQAELSDRYEERLANLRLLVQRARRHGLGVYLYLNEPRALPRAFFQTRPQYQGVVEGDYATLCTSVPEVQQYLIGAVAAICRAVPELAGFFTISASENLTNCWSHNGGSRCPRCGQRAAGEVIAEVNGLFYQGIQQARSQARLIAWDWGWAEAWVPTIIQRLPREVALMSVSEWDLPIRRGGVATTVGEYSLSVVGPGPRATRHWELARQRGLKTIAKIQAGNTWELSAVPYLPVMENVAQDALNLRQAKVDGLMLGWTLGGYPSPNLETVAEAARETDDGRLPDTTAVLERVARQRFGSVMAADAVRAWREFSTAFREFPFHSSLVYNAPLQVGPSNLLWGEPTGYRSTMVGIPYDDLDSWRAVYPPEVFIGQFEKVAGGFEGATALLRASFERHEAGLSAAERRSVQEELTVAEAAALHFRSTANQARFILARRQLANAKHSAATAPLLDSMEKLLQAEIVLARRLYALQEADSRIGFEATNQYYYLGIDLAEKVLNCHDLLTRWLPTQRSRGR